MRARTWALAAAVIAAAGCKTASKGDRVAASATGKTQDDVQVEPNREAGQSPRDVAERQAQEQAPSNRPVEGVGGHDPHPLPTGKEGDARYGGEVATPAPSMEGRTPESRTERSGGAVATPEAGAQAGASAGTQTQGGTASGGVQGGTASGGAQAGASGSVGTNEVNGRVALVDKQQRELAIDAGDQTTQVRVAKDAKITVDGKSASFEDIRQGAAVRATLDRSGDQPQATEVTITRSEKKK
jgi:hypothetical protein